ncbi:PREDICTED: RE1-silencing transcription factor [Drosophila arizonae]|uniref:RE1-silencing transcription factor n=1 Tax=Drosophila arizonae TaxID=7263 RepID=A0ABM1NPJ3_DROAR|nr:PREDICTED: RE1-silencing transcription factor [Drosophila arizonae]
MELPSMVERSGGRLVVRSLVSGVTVFQTAMEESDAAAAESANPMATHPLVSAEMLERQLQLLNNQTATAQPQPPMVPSAMSKAEQEDGCKESLPMLESRPEEELPQCKIRRNYSCNACAFFTQNPRSHLSHLRDVHGEKIVINECKLCLYASRHFQKLVRHMKMVHGCSDDDSNGLAGRRHCNREARKRRLEESIEAPTGMPAPLQQSVAAPVVPLPLALPLPLPLPLAVDADQRGATLASSAMQAGPSLKQLKSELQLQEQQLLSNVEAFNRQQQLQHLQQMVSRSANIFSMAFEFQMCMLMPASAILPSARPVEELGREPENSSSDSEASPPADECVTPEALDLSAGSSSVTQYQCQKCSYSTPIRARFKKHVKYHTMPLIKCGSCDFHSPYKWNLDRHTKNHGANGYFKCAVCDFSTNIKQSLTIHELNHHVARRSSSQEQQQQQQQQQQQVQHQAAGAAALDSSTDQAESMDPELCPSPIVGAIGSSSGSPLSELPPISCSHCQQRVPNAMELISHLQQCEPALRNTTQLACDMDLTGEEDFRGASTDLSYCGVETAPGYGEVTEQLQPEDSDALKKVFKCPHCTFWAATASRFHVHIVGHLNRKPFECSLCSYRSNWRWDITKHIRLKAMRDKSHTQAQVLMNDETGRRNYAKYNQYLTLMKVSAEQAADAKTMRCGEMQPSNLEQQHQQQLLAALPQLEEDNLEIQDAQSDSFAALDLRVSSKSHAEQPPAHTNERSMERSHSTQKQKHSKTSSKSNKHSHKG